jgi:molybdopterin-guanine dinucleotide biosynthesis protein A
MFTQAPNGWRADRRSMKISAIYISPGHNFFGRHGKPAGTHAAHSVREVECVSGRGLKGDRFWDYKREYAGQITFFDEAVHLAVLRELRPEPCSAAAYRRNVLTSGVNLSALIGQEFTVQGIRFLGMAESKPCYWMEQAVGPGTEAFLRGRGGLRAKIITDGTLRVDHATAAAMLLAGGRATRMGRDKAELEWESGMLGEHQAKTLVRTGAWPLMLSCRSDQSWSPRGFLRVEDSIPNGGVPSALWQGWTQTEADVLTVLAIDLPLARAEWLESLTIMARETQRSVVAWRDGHFEPLAAAWHRSSLPRLRAAIDQGGSLQSVCDALNAEGALHVWELTAAESEQLTNLNTPHDVAVVRDKAAVRLA